MGGPFFLGADYHMQKIKDLWPIILFILGITVAGANAQSMINNHESRILKLETAPERLATMEAVQKEQGKQLTRIELALIKDHP